MIQLDFKHFLKYHNNNELVSIVENELSKASLIKLLCRQKSQHKKLLGYITGKNTSLSVRELQLELNQKLKGLSIKKIMGLVKNNVSKQGLCKELLLLNEKQKQNIMNNQLKNEMANIFKKISEVAERVYQFPNEFNEIEELGQLLESINMTIDANGATKELNESKLDLTAKIEKKVEKVIKEYYGDRFLISTNGIDYKNDLPNITIHKVHAKTTVFEFYVDIKEHYVKFKGIDLKEGNHFFIIWLDNIVGIPESERFIYLNGIIGEDIVEIKSFMNKLYTVEISDWDNNAMYGIINTMGDVLVEPTCSNIVRLSNNYYKAYLINPNEKTNELGAILEEKWILVNENGKKIEFNCTEILTVDEDKSIVTIKSKDGELEYSITDELI